MSNLKRISAPVLVVGDSGEGKSTAIEHLPQDRTLVINTEDKPLPFEEYASFKVVRATTYKKLMATLQQLAEVDSVVKNNDGTETVKKGAGSKYDYVVIDSFTAIAEFIERYVTHMYNGFEQWKQYNLILSEIVNKVKAATKLPVTVKYRKGWDEQSINALEFGKLMQEAGADAVTLHGRTREQYYSGTADWEIIKELKEKLSIPVIANGDITSFEAAERILDITKADALMIGRGAQGNPFIFKEVNDYMESAILPKKICPKLKIDTAISHYKLALKYKTQHKAVTEMRKHLGWYLKGLKNSARIKDHINKMYEPSDVINALTEYAQSLT